MGHLKKLNLIPISYWLEIKDIVFYYKCMTGLYDLDIDRYIPSPSDLSINQPFQVLVTFCFQTCVELLYLGTHFLIELYIYGINYKMISNCQLLFPFLNLNCFVTTVIN